jgi:hypothetical protein
MAYATTDFAPAKSGARRGVFSRFFDAMVEARMRQAERLVTAHLQSFDAKTLKELGYDKQSLRKAALGQAR